MDAPPCSMGTPMLCFIILLLFIKMQIRNCEALKMVELFTGFAIALRCRWTYNPV